MADPETRYEPSVRRTYEGDGIVVHWEPALCIHVAACIRALPGTFDPNAAAIEGCPTGALSYARTDGADQEQPEVPTTIEARQNGPLFVRGEIEIRDAEGITRHATRAALCRCGASANKPYCDLSHRRIAFEG